MNEENSCPQCGGFLPETSVPHAVEVDSITCYRCWALDEHAKEHDKQSGEHRFAYPADQQENDEGVVA